MSQYIQYPTTLKLLIKEIKCCCDDYLSRRLPEAEFRDRLHCWAKYCGDKLFSGPDQFSPTLSAKLGKKRLALVRIMMDGFYGN